MRQVSNHLSHVFLMNRSFALVFGLIVFCGSCYAAESNVESNTNKASESIIAGKKFNLERGGGDLSEYFGNSSRKKTIEQVPHGPEDLFLSVNGEIVKWGEVDTHIDLLLVNSPLCLPPQATVEEVAQIIANTRAKYAEKLGNVYVRNALLAQKARECGISISSNELYAAICDTVSKIPASRRDKIRDGILTKDTYFKRDLENYQLTIKYRQEVLATNIVVSAEEIADAIAARKVEISQIVQTNATLRPRIEGYLRDIKAGKRDFGETAYDYSDCGSSGDDGDMGEFDRDCTLLSPLKDFVFSASTNTLSEVLETPYSYNIIKILGRTYDKDDETPEIPVSAHIAQIMLEKIPVPELLTEDSAKSYLTKKKLGVETVRLQQELFKTCKLQSALNIRLLTKQ